MQTRNAQIVAMAKQEPVPTLHEIGDRFGITDERVSQILAKLGYKKPRPAQIQPCKFIGCQKQIKAWLGPYCDTHTRTSKNGDTMLSKQFRALICSYCGKQFLRSEYEMRYVKYPNRLRKTPYHRWTFCSKTCQGKLFGRDFGFAAQQKARV